MRTEDFIARCKLLSLLRTLPDRDLTSDERLQLISAFRLFVRQIGHRARTEESKLDLLRLYACLRTAFEYLKVHRPISAKEQEYVLDAALSFLETERRIVLLQLRYPAAAAEPPRNEVPLAWSSAFTLADLMEVIVALHTLGAVRKPNGTPVTFKDLVRAFERFLNVSILNPDRCRYTTINRKLHLTKFLDTMREALVELSQR